MWDEEDGFYYDLLRPPNAPPQRMKVRSLVGLLPIAATTVIEPWQRERMPRMAAHLKQRITSMPQLLEGIHPTGPGNLGYKDRGILALVSPRRLRRILARMLDESEFLSPNGLRSISRYHQDHPYHINLAGHDYGVSYLPAESDSGMFGGNSNWRGPIWMPVNFLIIESLQKFHHYYGDDFRIEYPTRSGNFVTIKEVATELSRRVCKLFLKGSDGQRPVLKYHPKLASDPHFKDHVLFHEFFHGDTGRGGGSPHQTGWTGLVAKLLQPRRKAQQTADATITSQPAKASKQPVTT
ncbi:MAG TPA: glucosidase, partial [Verrucomicrobiae bacterium]|nr:glucosidase [Verrucomicrobiae bacterium]